MQANRIPFLDRLISKYEGGYCWDAADPGGPTKYGITCYDLAEHRGVAMTSMSEWAPLVRGMQMPEAEDIYNKKYLAGIRFDDLPSGIDVVIADYAINSGVGRPILVSCRLLSLPPSSKMTNALVDALKKVNRDWFINAMCDERLQFMKSIRGGSSWAKFGHGWAARVSDLRAYGEHLAAGGQANTPAIDLSHTVTPKAVHTKKGNGAAVVVGTVAGSAGSTASHSVGATALESFLVAVAIVAACVAYAVWRDHKAVAANHTVVLPPGIVPVKV